MMLQQIGVAIVGALATGVLAGGVGLLKWGMGVNLRLLRLEIKNGVKNDD